MGEFKYCEKCNDVLTDEDSIYADMCNECGLEEETKQID